MRLSAYRRGSMRRIKFMSISSITQDGTKGQFEHSCGGVSCFLHLNMNVGLYLFIRVLELGFVSSNEIV